MSLRRACCICEADGLHVNVILVIEAMEPFANLWMVTANLQMVSYYIFFNKKFTKVNSGGFTTTNQSFFKI